MEWDFSLPETDFPASSLCELRERLVYYRNPTTRPNMRRRRRRRLARTSRDRKSCRPEGKVRYLSYPSRFRWCGVFIKLFLRDLHKIFNVE